MVRVYPSLVMTMSKKYFDELSKYLANPTFLTLFIFFDKSRHSSFSDYYMHKLNRLFIKMNNLFAKLSLPNKMFTKHILSTLFQ